MQEDEDDAAANSSSKPTIGRSRIADKNMTLAGYFFGAALTRLVLLYLTMRDYQLFSIESWQNFSSFLEKSAFHNKIYPSREKMHRFYHKGESDDILLELAFCRLVDIFEHFLKDLLSMIYIHDPRTLAASDQIAVTDVVKFSTMEEFIGFYAKSRVERISFAGFDRIVEAFDRVGLIVIETQQRDRLRECIKIRNKIVHQNIFSASIDVKNLFRQNNEAIRGEFTSFQDAARYIGDIVERAEQEAVVKFKFDETWFISRAGD